MKEKVEAPVVNFPKINIWNTNVALCDKLQIINSEDFPLEAIRKNLGIENNTVKTSLGISDTAEIRQRQEIMKLIMDNKKFRDFLIDEKNLDIEFPLNHEDFLRYNNPEKEHNPFWSRIHQLFEMLERLPIRSEGLRTFRRFLKSTLYLEEIEKTMAKRIGEKMDAMAVIEGVITFRIAEREWSRLGEVISKKIYGYRIYSLPLTQAGKKPYPEWVYKDGMVKKLRLNRLGEIFIDAQNNHELIEALKGRRVNDLSNEMIDDLRRETTRIFLASQKEAKNSEKFERFTGKLCGGTVSIHFEYSVGGLDIQIYNIVPGKDCDVRRYSKNYSGCIPEKEGKRIIALREMCYDSIKTLVNRMTGASVIYNLCNGEKDFFDKNYRVDSPSFDAEHKHFALSNIFQDPEIKPIGKVLDEYRVFCHKQFNLLGNLAELARNYESLSKRISAPISFPEILPDDQNIVAFEEIFPVHLALQDEKDNKLNIVPIRQLPPVNGTMLALTGTHGGGKTVTELTLAINTWLAQSGLPVFGRGFRLNIKDSIGLVFINRGEGSTCELLVGKIKNVLEVIARSDHKKILLILDELGTGTQEDSGFELGRDLLVKLGKEKISVLFSTQITSLAEFAEKELGAQSFKFMPDHSILPGIGKGGMEGLRERTGINELLAITN